MPTVARYGNAKVESAPIPGVRRTAAETPLSEGANVDQARAQADETAGAAIGAPLMHVGAAAYEQIQREERQSADEIAVLKAKNALADWKAKALFDPSTGVFAQRGEAAFPLPEQVRGQFTETAGKIAADLKTPEQRMAFEKVQAEEWPQIDLSVRRHVLDQMQEYHAGELKSFVGNTVDDAIRSAQDPRMVGRTLQKAVDAIRTNAPRLGQGPEMVATQIGAVQSSVHVGVISQLLASDQEGNAREYFNATKDQIHADRLDEITKALDVGTLRKHAQQQSDAIIRGGGTMAEQREKARAIDDPKLRDEVMQRIEHEGAVTDRAEREQREATSRQVYNILDTQRDVSKIPPAVWAEMSGSERREARSYVDSLTRGDKIETDDPTYYALSQQAIADPNTFLNQNLLNYRTKLSDGDFKHMVGLQQQVRAGQQEAASKTLDDFRSTHDVVNKVLSGAGFDPTPASADVEGNARVSRFFSLVASEQRRVQEVTGKKVSNEDMEAIGHRILAQEVVKPGWIWNGKQKLIEAGPADIPKTDRTQIEDSLRRFGYPVNDDAVLDVWLRSQVRKGGR